MALTSEEVRHIARLARLDLTEEQQALYREQLAAILDYVARLRLLDTTDMPRASAAGLAPTPLRPDEPRPGLSTDELLSLAPDVESGQFKLPPLFE